MKKKIKVKSHSNPIPIKDGFYDKNGKPVSFEKFFKNLEKESKK